MEKSTDYRELVAQHSVDPKQARLLRAVAEVRGKASAQDKDVVARFIADDAANNVTVSTFVEKSYLPWAESELRNRTAAEYKGMWERYRLSERVGQLRVRDFRTKDASALLQQIFDEYKVGRCTLQHLKFLLSGIFVLAKNRGLFDGENPVRDAMLPSRAHGPGETHAYELEQILAMLRLPFTAATKAAIAVAGFAGLRESEIRGLRWDDYDGSEITVRRSIDRTDGKAHPPKSVKSATSVPVISQLRLLLDAHKKTAKPGPWIFPGIEQETCDFDKLAQRTIKPVLTAAGLQWRGWHAFPAWARHQSARDAR